MTTSPPGSVLTARAEEVRAGLAHLGQVDLELAALIDQRPDYDPDAWRLELPVMDLFGCLLLQITGQQISMKAANAIFGRLSNRFGHIPSPAEVVTLDAPTLRELGYSWRKAATVLDLAAHFTDGRLDEQRLRQSSDDQIVAELTDIRGIGPWTVQGALIVAMNREDVVPYGDIMLRKTVRDLYGLDQLPTEAEFAEIAEPWRPYRSLGANLLFAAAENGAR